MQEQKQYGDSVVYVRNGVAINALVLMSTMQAVKVQPAPTDFEREQGLFVPQKTVLEEHLSLAYLDPVFGKGAMSSTDMDRAKATAIGIGPLSENGTNGWREAQADRIEGSPRENDEAVQYGEASEEIARLRYALSQAPVKEDFERMKFALEQEDRVIADLKADNEALKAEKDALQKSLDSADVIIGQQVKELASRPAAAPPEVAAVDSAAATGAPVIHIPVPAGDHVNGDGVLVKDEAPKDHL